MYDQKEPIKSFTQLEAWKEAHTFVVTIYQVTKKFPQDEQFGLTNQIRRAAVSISSNIAEGFSRQSFKEKVQFYSTSLGSLTETQNQLLISRDVGYVDQETFQKMANQTVQISKLISGLIRYAKSQIPDTKYQILKKQKGSILLELILTLGSVAVVTLALVLAMLSGTQLGLRAERQAIASQLAHQQLEILRGRPVTSLVNQTDGALIGSPTPSLTNLPQGAASLTIRDWQNDPALKEVTVTVSFQEGTRRVQLVFATLMGAGGLNG
jgi:four helix bundle protein